MDNLNFNDILQLSDKIQNIHYFHRLTFGGRTAQRDIVQFVPFRNFQQVSVCHSHLVKPATELL